MNPDTSIVLSASQKFTDSGLKLVYGKVYEVTLTELEPIVDWYVPCDFAGWRPNFMPGMEFFQRTSQRLSLYPQARMMSLLGKIGDQVIDLGRRWADNEKQPFFLCVEGDTDDNDTADTLYLACNDAPGFFWNNRGRYQVTLNTFGE